ncbi:MAG TPA: hypothetical protein VHM31_01885 [Polyangia bacterium]|nr:hypothetical protein [Polyangia bacterium]
MTRSNLAPFSAAAAVLLATMTLTGCSPSIDPAAKADIDRRVGMLQAGGTALPPPTTFMPMPLAPGQWSQYKMTDDKGQPSFMTYKIVGEDGGAYWVEILHETYFGADAQKMLIAFGSRTDPNQVEIRGVVTRDRKGRVNEMPPNMMPLLQSMYKSVVSALVISWQGLPQEPAAVPAGRFDGCFHARSSAQWGPWKSVADSWSHPAVPINGVVRTQGVDRPFTMELVAYGTTGATASF